MGTFWHIPVSSLLTRIHRAAGWLAVCGIAGAMTLAGAAPAAAETCKAFPRDAYVGSVSHAQVSDYVAQVYRGDWSGYIRDHVARIRALEERYRSGRPLAVDRNGQRVELAGSPLEAYVRAARQRLSIVRCLSRDTAAPLKTAATGQTTDLNAFSTAAGGTQLAVLPNSPPPDERGLEAVERVRLNLPNNPGKPSLDVAVTAQCVGGEVQFKVTNMAAPFPAPGEITVYRIGITRQIAKSRRIRLNTKQSASFKLAAADGPARNYGLFIKPSWYPRPFTFDATVTCQ